MNFAKERERAYFQKFTLQPETFNAFHCAFLLFSVSEQSVFLSALFNCQLAGASEGKVCPVK